jgi:hypothetical protein
MATVTESFYAGRLRRTYDPLKKDPFYRWWYGRTRFATMQEITELDMQFHEETYEGFQLVIVEHKYQLREPFNSNGETFSLRTTFDVTLIAGLHDPKVRSDFYAYAWKIGDPSDQNQDLAYTGQFAILEGICVSTSLEKTRKGALAKLKIYADVEAVKDQLISICEDRLNSRAGINPYNVTIGDQVFIHAHGRLRKGIVTGTTGSRFIVGYVTPSNHEDAKYKIVHMAQTYVKDAP